jgi:hypothetical protein
MVGQQVLGQSAEKRAAQTHLYAEAVLRACERLQFHLREQDLAIRQAVEHLPELPLSALFPSEHGLGLAFEVDVGIAADVDGDPLDGPAGEVVC